MGSSLSPRGASLAHEVTLNTTLFPRDTSAHALPIECAGGQRSTETCPGLTPLGKGTTNTWKGGGHNSPKSPTFGDLDFLPCPRLPPALWSRRPHSGVGRTSTEPGPRRQDTAPWAAQPPALSPDLPATSPGLTCCCLYLEREDADKPPLGPIRTGRERISQAWVWAALLERRGGGSPGQGLAGLEPGADRQSPFPPQAGIKGTADVVMAGRAAFNPKAQTRALRTCGEEKAPNPATFGAGRTALRAGPEPPRTQAQSRRERRPLRPGGTAGRSLAPTPPTPRGSRGQRAGAGRRGRRPVRLGRAGSGSASRSPKGGGAPGWAPWVRAPPWQPPQPCGPRAPVRTPQRRTLGQLMAAGQPPGSPTSPTNESRSRRGAGGRGFPESSPPSL